MQSPSLAAFTLLALLLALAVAVFASSKPRVDASSYHPSAPVFWQVR
jgi:hypothetical protein